jgi:protein-S-isoprenylcysteine O-methyltransferase Ste14
VTTARRVNPLVPPPVIVVVIGALMWAVDKMLPWGRLEWAFGNIVAMGLLAIGLLLIAFAAIQFIIAKTTINPLRPSHASNLVTSGVFAISRNPIYLGDLLLLAAYAVWLANVINIVLLPAFVWLIHRYQIVPEEQALTQRFGSDYENYCLRVRRWL